MGASISCEHPICLTPSQPEAMFLLLDTQPTGSNIAFPWEGEREGEGRGERERENDSGRERERERKQEEETWRTGGIH